MYRLCLSGNGRLTTGSFPLRARTQPQSTMSSRHGDADGIVRYSWGQHSAEKLKELGVDKYRFETYRVRGGLCV